jgi:hypothetical protein
VSHLLFTDDTLLFLEATEQQTEVVQAALEHYERCTGQLIKPSKCFIMFGNGCLQPDRDKVKDILKVCVEAADEKYLSLPTPEGRITKNKFKSTKERWVRKFTNWVERNMSVGARKF